MMNGIEDIDVHVDVLEDVEYCNALEDVDNVVGVKLVSRCEV